MEYLHDKQDSHHKHKQKVSLTFYHTDQHMNLHIIFV